MSALNRFAYVCADPGIPIPGSKGASIHVAQVVDTLCDLGLRGNVHCQRPQADRWLGKHGDDVDIRRLPGDPGPKGEAPDRRELRLLGNNRPLDLAVERPDFIYERYSLWHYGGLSEARRLGVPFVLEVNSPLPDEASRYRSLAHPTAAEGIAEVLCRNADGVVCVSDGVADWVRSRGAEPDRVWTIPNGVDAELFAPAEEADRERATLPFVGEPTVLVFIGSFRPWHGLDDLLAAFEMLCEHREDVALLMIGDGPERPRCEERVRSSGRAERVHFTGAVDRREVAAWARAAHIAMAPYPALESFYFSPLKLFEFMALGLPIVTTDTGQIAELMGAGERGLLCPPGDVSAIVAAVTKVLEDRDTANELGRTAREWILDQGTWDHRVRAMLERLEAIR